MRRLNSPLWLDGADTNYPAMNGAVDVDVAVVGAGITGTTAAYLLKRAGRSVALLESDRICAGATGYTTAKLTVGHSLVYRELIDSFGVETARRYARSNQQAIESVAGIVDSMALTATSNGPATSSIPKIPSPLVRSSARSRRPGAPVSMHN